MNAPPSSLEDFAQLCGLSSETILLYPQHGLLHSPHSPPPNPSDFDDSTIHRLHRIEHLRTAYGMEIAALQLTLTLFDEIDSLRSTLRSRR